MPRTTARAAWLDWRFNPQAPSTNPAFLIAVGERRAALRGAGRARAPRPAARRSATSRRARAGSSSRSAARPPTGPAGATGGPPARPPRRHAGARGGRRAVGHRGRPRSWPAARTRASMPLEVARDRRRLRRPARGRQPRRRRRSGRSSPPTAARDDRLPPCPQTLRGTLDVDTRLVPDGARRLRLVVTDAAGNSRTIDAGDRARRQPARVRHPAGSRRRRRAPASRRRRRPGAGSGAGRSRPRTSGAFPPNPLAGPRPRAQRPPRERAGPARRLARAAPRARRAARRRSVTVPYGVRVRIRGRLTDERGRGDRPRDARRDPPRARPARGGWSPASGPARTGASRRSPGSGRRRSSGSSTTPTATRRAGGASPALRVRVVR